MWRKLFFCTYRLHSADQLLLQIQRCSLWLLNGMHKLVMASLVIGRAQDPR